MTQLGPSLIHLEFDTQLAADEPSLGRLAIHPNSWRVNTWFVAADW